MSNCGFGNVKAAVAQTRNKLLMWLITCAQVQNEQCQEMAQTDDQKWIKVTNNGEWDTHTVSTKFCLFVLVGVLA